MGYIAIDVLEAYAERISIPENSGDKNIKED
jgi:hypothetical protein